MDLVQIRYFLALARTLNFTRAAEACNVTQPALTKSIQRLEGELGGALLLRERSLTQLTELGRDMLPLLQQTYAAASRAKEHAASLKRRTTWPLRVGFEPDAPVEPFLPVFAALIERLPGLELTLAEDVGAELADGLLHGRLDVALLTGGEQLGERLGERLEGRLNRWRLFREHAVVVLPPGDALAALDSVPLSALAGRPLIGRVASRSAGEPDAAPDTAPDAAPDAALPPPRHRVATPHHAMHLVRAGFGVAVSTGRGARDPSLPCRPLEPAIEHQVVLATVAGRPYGRAADGFIKLARARGWEAA